MASVKRSLVNLEDLRKRKRFVIAHSRVAFSWCFSPLVFVITVQSGSRPGELSPSQTVPSKEVVKCFL